MIPYGKQSISQDDINAVVKVLESEFLTQGPVVPLFENAVSKYCNAKFSVATSNATSALHLACLALGVSSGDIVWTSPITFVASANCARYCGAEVEFIDIDPFTYNISIELLSKKLAEARQNNVLPKVIIPVHLCGNSCDMEKIYDLAIEYGFKIIEDASHALGGKYKGNAVGSCLYSDITVFSLHPVKIITSGEGGLAITNNKKYAETMRRLRSHGISTDESMFIKHNKSEIWNYQQIELGFNYRMTDIQAALGLSQLDRLDEFVSRRNYLAERYQNKLSALPIQLPILTNKSYSSFHLYVIRLDLNACKRNQREFYDYMRSKNILVNIHYIPVYKHPYYQCIKNYMELKHAEQYFSEAITLPLFPDMTEVEQDEIVKCVTEACI